MSDAPKRYQVVAAWPESEPEHVGEADDCTTANRLAIAAFLEGAIRVSQHDTEEPPPTVATAEERARIAALTERVRNFEP